MANGENKPESEQGSRPRRKSWLAWPMGLVAGSLSGLFGAGGGMVMVPMLRWMGLPDKQCHATAMAVMFPLVIGSAGFYLEAGQITLRDALPYLPGGLVGALVGAWLLPRMETLWLRRIFGGVILFSAGRLLLA